MRLSPTGLELLKRFEGFSARPYRCPAGKMTIGYGHVIAAGEEWREVTQRQGEMLLLQDVERPEQAVSRLCGEALAQPRFDALACLTYNIGVYAFEKSTLLKLLVAGNADGAALEFDKWVYAGGKKNVGLVNRRAREKALFLS